MPEVKRIDMNVKKATGSVPDRRRFLNNRTTAIEISNTAIEATEMIRFMSRMPCRDRWRAYARNLAASRPSAPVMTR